MQLFHSFELLWVHEHLLGSGCYMKQKRKINIQKDLLLSVRKLGVAQIQKYYFSLQLTFLTLLLTALDLTLTRLLKTPPWAKPSIFCQHSTEEPPSTCQPILLQDYHNSISFPKWHQKTTLISQNSSPAKPCSSSVKMKVQWPGREGSLRGPWCSPATRCCDTPRWHHTKSPTGWVLHKAQHHRSAEHSHSSSWEQSSCICPKMWAGIAWRERISSH